MLKSLGGWKGIEANPEMYFYGSNMWHGYAGRLGKKPIVPVVSATIDRERKDGCVHDAVMNCRLLGKGIL